MKHFDTLLICILYPGVEGFLKEYFSSLNKQSDKDFVTLIFNDGIKIANYEKFFPKNCVVINNNKKLSPAFIRYYCINYALINTYEKVIFTDSDDFYSSNRVELFKEKLNKYSIVINELTITNRESVITVPKLFSSGLFKYPFSQKYDLLDYNVFGFTNTGISLAKVKLADYRDLQTTAVDWFFFTYLVFQENCNIHFLSNVTSYYRQYDNNIAMLLKVYNVDMIERALAIKLEYYSKLLSVGKLYSGLFIEEVKKRIKAFKKLSEYFKKKENLIHYTEIVNKHLRSQTNGWWSHIIDLQKMRELE